VTELTATYGPGAWLTMPTRELLAYVEQRPRVEARRALDHAQEIAVGMGRLRPDDHRSTIARWRHDLTTGDAHRPRTADDLSTAVRSTPLGFRTVKRKPAA
jgi:hypothetical protein